MFTLALFFGGLAQFIAGFLEFKNGNNFGFAAFTTYGAFWMAVALIFVDGKNAFWGITAADKGYFFLIYIILTFIYFIGAMKQSGALSFVFLTLLIGYIFLTIGEFTEVSMYTKIAAGDLFACGASALYVMAHVIYEKLPNGGIRLPVGKPWTGSKTKGSLPLSPVERGGETTRPATGLRNTCFGLRHLY